MAEAERSVSVAGRAADAMARLVNGYGLPEKGRFDEALEPNGRPRAHWAPFLAWLARSGPRAYAASATELQRLRAESGVAFTAQDLAGHQQSDTLPVLFAPEEWAALEAAVLQRARLAEAAVADLYGPGQMVATGVVPPGLVYGDTAFAAQSAGWDRPPKRWTFVYECDLARAADGRWIVMADRLDTPLGDGWLIANRIATSQALADPFLELGVRRLASHYAEFQALLDSMTGWEGRLALLTGGEKDPRFFSHAYFARYLNAALIEPADITVRDGAAFVKTLDGLKKIDVLLRGVPDRTLDALHRPADAARGAPALTLAARSGALTVANGIGSAVYAYRALAPYAHRLSQALLGEDLLMNDAPCLWLGLPEAREQVLDEPGLWRIEPLTHAPRDASLPSTAAENRPALEAMLTRLGERYVAVATPPLARTPVWRGDGIAPGEWMMRVFACYTEGGWSLAPGGVATVVEPGCPPPALGFGKDVWVLPGPADRLAPPPKLLADRLAGAHLRRTGRDLLSRVADEVFWLGRNAERAEGVLRLLNVCLRRHLSGNRTDSSPDVLCEMVAIHARLGSMTDPGERFRDAVRRLVNEMTEPWGLPGTLRALRSGAVRARMSISEESWRYIDRLCSDPRWLDGLDLRRSADLLRLIDDSLRALAAFAGSAQENLTRNFAWRFLEMGRRIERGYETARVAEHLGGRVHETEETYLRGWLVLCDSTSAYRSRYMMVPRAAAVLDLLVLDESNPRALAFQIAQLESVIAQLPSDNPYRRPEHRKALGLLTEIRLSDADALAAADAAGTRPAVLALAERCGRDLSAISDLLARAFFAHADAPVALVSQGKLGAPQ